MSREKLAVALVLIGTVLVTIATFYTLITVITAEINPVAALAAITVAIAGLAWFKKTSFNK